MQQEPLPPRKINPAIPRDLETVVIKALACNPAHRYQTAEEMAADLKAFLDDRPIRARRTTPVGRLWRWCRRNRAIAALAGTALCLLATVAVVASAGYLRTANALERASEARRQAESAFQQAELQRGKTTIEHRRAEANLRLATKVLEDIFNKLASDPLAQPANDDDDDDDMAEPTWAAALSDHDAALLESMLEFYDQFAHQNQADLRLQQENAKALRRAGDIGAHLGQYEKAEAAYRHALASYQELADGRGYRRLRHGHGGD